MKRYKIRSAPMIFTPGMFRWIIATIRPFDVPKAAELFASMGLPQDIADRFAAGDESIRIEYDDAEETAIVTVSDPEWDGMHPQENPFANCP